MTEQDRVRQLASFADVVRWVIEEAGAMCPSPERLASYRDDPEASHLSDVRYHVREARCRICLAELDELDGSPSPME